MFVVPKEMEYSLLCYHLQDQMTSPMLPPPLYIDAIVIKWEHDDVLDVDHFSEFLHWRRMLDVPGDMFCIISFCLSLTQPMPSYYCFVMSVLEVVIPFKSLSLFPNVATSSADFDSSSKDIDATLFL